MADDSRGHERREWAEIARPLLAAALLAARAVIGDANTDEVTALAASGLAGRLEKSGHRWFTFDSSYRAWAALVADATLDVAADPQVVDRLAEAAPELLRDSAPALWLDLAAGLARRGAHSDRAADLCLQAAARARTDACPAAERLDLLARAAEIARGVAPELGRQLFDEAVDATTGINDGAARLLAVHADLASRAAIGAADRPAVAARLIRAAEAVAPHVTDIDVIPYEAVAGAAGTLASDVALAAVSHWDDEDRIRLARTLPAALLGAVDGGGVPAAHALALDHLVEDNLSRLQYLLATIDRLRHGAAGINWATVPPVDLVTAGFPAGASAPPGRGAGIKEGTRSGLWTPIAQALGQLRPSYVLVENAAALRARSRPGLAPWPINARLCRHVKPAAPPRHTAVRPGQPGPRMTPRPAAHRGRTRTQGRTRGRPARGTSASWRACYQAFRHADLTIGPGRACIHHTARTASGTDTHQPACAAGCRHRRREAGVAGEPDELLTIEELIAELRVPRSTFYRWREKRIAPRVMKLPSGAVRIRRIALEEWLRGFEDDPKEHAA